MPVVIHGECSRFCVMDISLRGKYFIHKVFHEFNHIFSVYIWIRYRKGVEDKFSMNIFRKAFFINIAKISKMSCFLMAIMLYLENYTNSIVVR